MVRSVTLARLTVFLSLSRWKKCDCGVRLIGGACLRPVCVCVWMLSKRQQCISMGLMWKLSILLIQTTMLHRRLLPFGCYDCVCLCVCMWTSLWICYTLVWVEMVVRALIDRCWLLRSSQREVKELCIDWLSHNCQLSYIHPHFIYCFLYLRVSRFYFSLNALILML